MSDLTPRQQQILGVIEESAARGCVPTLREVGEAVGLPATDQVYAYVAELEQMGRLRQIDPTWADECWSRAESWRSA